MTLVQLVLVQLGVLGCVSRSSGHATTMFNACDFVGGLILQVSVDKLLQDMRRTTTPAAPAAVDKIHLVKDWPQRGRWRRRRHRHRLMMDSIQHRLKWRSGRSPTQCWGLLLGPPFFELAERLIWTACQVGPR